jgi:hypothetical protein
MDKVKEYINHPLTKCLAMVVVGAILLLESHPLYAGVAFGMGLREMFFAFKK